jgi:hypothetical protein
MQDDPAHWRKRAQETRAEADKMGDADAKRILLEIAEAFDRLASIADQRGRRGSPPPSSAK